MRSPWAAFVFVLSVCVPTSVSAQTNADAAKRLFDGEHWPEAAAMLHDVYASAPAGIEKDLAQYRLGIAFYNMGLKQAAYAIFAEIADKPNHTKFGETLLWLAKLWADLPEPADVIERVGKYDEQRIAAFNNAAQHELYWRLSYLLGRYDYRNLRFEQAIAHLAHVDVASPLYGKAQFYIGIANVRTRHAMPSVQSFQRIVLWLDADAHQDAGRLRDLANLSLARTYYSASNRIDENNQPIVDALRLSASLKFYRRVGPAGEYFLDSLFEASWAYFMAADYPHALGNLRMLSSPDVAPRFAEGAVLEAVILFTLCRYDDATAVLARMRQTYEPRRTELTRAIEGLQKMDEPARVQWVRSGGHGAASDALADRMMASYLEYDAVLDAEHKRFEKSPAGFRSSKAADDVRDGLTLAQEIVKRQISDLAEQRLLRARDELNQHLRDALKVTIDITAAQRDVIGGGTVAADNASTSPKPPTMLSWAVNGTSGVLDPYGLYRVPITPKCGK